MLALPEQGQIASVRQRRYVVTDVRASALPANPLYGSVIEPQHLVTLTSIEDDALGETLQVVWEIEPGAQVTEKVALPAPLGFDPPATFDAFLDAVRWGAVASADVSLLQAPFRSGIEIEDYQLDPLVRAVQMPRANLLIADDVGLGKTVEAGLVIQELIVRGRARSVLVVCPASLQFHWRDQMREKFGLEFRIVDAELMRQLRCSRGIHVNPWAHFPRLITSIDYLKRDRPLRLLREILPERPTYPRKFDILVIDEAHNVAPSGRGRYATDSQRTLAIREIAPHFEHKLFLTATPHNGYQESFSALLELLDNQRFARTIVPDRRQLEAVMVRRLKTEIEDWDGKPRFPRRRLEVIEVDYSEEERQVHAWLKEYSQLRQDSARDESERFATEFVLKLLKKRLFSSPAAFAATLTQHEQTLAGRGQARPEPQRVGIDLLRREIAQMEEDYADDAEYEEAAAAAVQTSTRALPALAPRERWLLDRMHDWAQQAKARRDCKAQALVSWLRAIVKPDGHWTDERVIIFTEYRATQKWLAELLVSEGLAGGERLALLYGGMDDDSREAIKAAFQTSPQQSQVRILLATDAASEGIDLQNHCHRLLHVEIPWNPNRMEQRNGRIDRHGQRHDPLVYHFVGKGYRKRSVDALAVAPSDLDADLEFLMTAVTKVEQIGHVYEGLLDHRTVRAAEPVLGLAGARDSEPEIALAALEAQAARPEPALLEYIRSQTLRTPNAIKNGLKARPDALRAERLAAACGNDPALASRVLPWAGLVRDDGFGFPVVIRPGSFYVTAGTERRSSGTHYTPRTLTEPIVQHTLEPLVYAGPAEGLPRERWQLRSPAEILGLKVCDKTMGSGAFLVQAHRYLAERLVEAWGEAEGGEWRVKGGGTAERDVAAKRRVLITADGERTEDPNRAIPADPDDRMILARRLVAERCLYGVDKNPLAVEMAKLSLWLVTMAKNRPFDFLDHALKCGDSLVGVDEDQFLRWSQSLKGVSGPVYFEENQRSLALARQKRDQLRSFVVKDVRDAEEKARLLDEAEAAIARVRRACDLLVGVDLVDGLSDAEREAWRQALLIEHATKETPTSDKALAALDAADRHKAFHWFLEFPEVFENGGAAANPGFHAFVGNPPFIGGKRIRDTLGDDYREALLRLYPGSNGNGDYCAFFFLRAFEHLRHDGKLGLIATNTIAQGETRRMGLEVLIQKGATIYHATNSQPWPGQAAVVVSILQVSKQVMSPPFMLDGQATRGISALLNVHVVSEQPRTLIQNRGRSHIGSYVHGLGFTMEPSAAQELIRRNPKNKEALFPYLIGLELNITAQGWLKG